MKNKIKIKGVLKSYLQISIYLGILLSAVALALWFVDIRSGFILTAFTLFYFLIITGKDFHMSSREGMLLQSFLL